MEKLDEFTFDVASQRSSACDICRQEFDTGLEAVVLDDGTERTVCPACTMFAKGDLLRPPATVETEEGYLTENIESLETGDYGLTWSSKPDSKTGADAESGATRVDEQQMLIQLIGVYQQADGLPSPAELDEKTDFGFLAYSEQFGDIEDALREAGFDV